MKKNAKGFTLLETLIVSTFVIGALIYLFSQINNIKTSYDISFRYNTIPGIYSSKNIADFLVENGYSNLISLLNSSSNGYIEIQNSSNVNGNSEHYRDIVTKINASIILFTKSDLTDLKTKLNECNKTSSEICKKDEDLRNFIKNLKNGSSDKYRIITEFNDGTFASVEIG